MKFQHSEQVWQQHPDLVAGVVEVHALATESDHSAIIADLMERSRALLAGRAESDLPQIQAWRRTFSRMGLKPTQYRCAAEALLRRFRKEDALPTVHPLVDLYNALSIAYAIPIGAFDLAHVHGDLTVRHADGDEVYESFSGDTESPAEGEVIFADDGLSVHARRWSNRQSARSAIGPHSSHVLVVAEAFHAGAHSDIEAMLAEFVNVTTSTGSDVGPVTLLKPAHPVFISRD